MTLSLENQLNVHYYYIIHTFRSVANVANSFPSGENDRDTGIVLHWK